jgi:hypothetical protein
MNIGIYFDATGYGITGYSVKGDCFYIDYLEQSEKPSLKGLLSTVTELRAKEIYCNHSRLLLGALYGLNVGVRKQAIKQDRETDSEIIYSDCFETISALLADNQIVVSQQIETQFTDSFRDYNPEEINHLVLSVFHSVAVQYLNSAHAKTLIGGINVPSGRNRVDRFRGYMF